MWVDAAGAVVLASCVIGVIAVLADAASIRESMPELRRFVNQAERRIQGIEESCRKVRVEIEERQEELENPRYLPHVADVDVYFQAVATIAQRHQVDLLQQRPLGAEEYPGLTERRFIYKVAADGRNLMAFLKEIESTEYWADIGFLRIENVPTQGGKAVRPTALLTFSLFAHRDQETG